MTDMPKRVSLRHGDFAISIEGFEDPVRPIRMLLRTLQNVIEETPVIANAQVMIDDDAIEKTLERLRAQSTDPMEDFAAYPALVLVRTVAEAEEAGDVDAGLAAAAFVAPPEGLVEDVAEPVMPEQASDVPTREDIPASEVPSTDAAEVSDDRVDDTDDVSEAVETEDVSPTLDNAPDDVAEVASTPEEVAQAVEIAPSFEDEPSVAGEEQVDLGDMSDEAPAEEVDAVSQDAATETSEQMTELAPGDEAPADHLSEIAQDDQTAVDDPADPEPNAKDSAAPVEEPRIFGRYTVPTPADELTGEAVEPQLDDNVESQTPAAAFADASPFSDPEPQPFDPASADDGVENDADETDTDDQAAFQQDPDPVTGDATGVELDAEASEIAGDQADDPAPAEDAVAEEPVAETAPEDEASPAAEVINLMARPAPAEADATPINIFAPPSPRPAAAVAAASVVATMATEAPVAEPQEVVVDIPVDTPAMTPSEMPAPSPPMVEVETPAGTRHDRHEISHRDNAAIGAPGEPEESPVERPVLEAATPEPDAADTSAASLASAAGCETVPELLSAAAAYLTLIKEQNRFTRREVMTIFDDLPGDHSRALEARIKGYGKLVRNGQLVLVGDGLFALSQNERDRFSATMETRH